MHSVHAPEGIAAEAFLGEPLRGFYAPYRPETLAETRVRVLGTGHHYVLKHDQGSYSDISNINLQLVKLMSFQAGAAERWKEHVLDSNASSDVDSLSETVAHTLDYVAEFGPGALDLRGLTPAGVQCEHLASVLRATTLWQDRIPGWHEALAIAQDACTLAGQNIDDVLFGMV